MCFRPPSVSSQNECPICGQENTPGTTVCIECGMELPKSAPDLQAPGAAVQPGAAPKPPGTAAPRPSAPRVPKEPPSRI